MDLVQTWTGRTACALQEAMRLTNDGFASRLGISLRTVGNWHAQPDMEPKKEMQQLLDHLLERATDADRTRFQRLVAVMQETSSAVGLDAGLSLKVAIAVVVNDSAVLVVQRRGEDGGGISWQFPAGMVKPGMSIETVAVRETFAETGIHCAPARHLGGRLHPITNVYCEYLLCDYLAGEPENRDEIENVSVVWAPTSKLTRFIPAGHIFPPILEALEVTE